ncbi:MAG TPA: SEC-C metal-binding domain-containing protein, partial [Acidimicrobiales bacterium]
VAKSEQLSRLLERRGIPHEVLNAKQHTREAEIVVQAGRLHAVTVATNMAGRGVDILLGGNPEGLAQREAIGQGLDLETDEGVAEYEKLLARFEKECSEEGDQIRALGGLYVLGSERHESRRIDNQLRGRSGRQGDPGESRFFLSLEDELMRLFATGAMQWVMTKTLPDDVPIEAKMVTKAIERAQNTVEGRNAEIRKDVLKYDEVLNEQRKVIYKRRLQVIDGENLKEDTEELLEATIEALVQSACPSEYPEEWELERLVAEVTLYYPTAFTAEDLAPATTIAQITESFVAEAIDAYQARDAVFPGGETEARQVEREVMLQIIDQRWREHLSEMDYLREGINLRAMGQLDPLVAWQREGFQMFGQMMDAIDDDYLRYVMHVQVVSDTGADLDLTQARYEAAEDPSEGPSLLEAFRATAPEAAAVAAGAGVPLGLEAGGQFANGAQATPQEMTETLQPLVKAPTEKLGRNEPCWCGSGKKFKLCHGAS